MHDRVSSGTGGNEEPSIAVDAYGRVHIAYSRFVGSNDSEIIYAVREGSAWTRTQVTDNARSDFGPSLTVSGDGDPHIVYSREVSGEDIYYATRPGATWTHTRVTNDTDQYFNSSIALDGDCGAHIVYKGNYGIHYASDVDGWASSAVTTTADAELATADRAIAIDGSGFVAVTYMYGSGNDTEIYRALSKLPVGTAAGTCCVPRLVGCGQATVGGTAGHASVIDRYSCMPEWWAYDEDGPEVLYALRVTQGLNDVTATLSDLGGVDLDVFILSSAGCGTGICLQEESYGDNSATASYVMPGTYYIAVDGYNGAEGSFWLTVTCTPVGKRAYLPTALRGYP
jgi:hypothetical protein